MKTSSAKAKGRRLQNYVAEKLRKLIFYTSLGYDISLDPDDIKPAIMGESGIDIKLSPKAKTLIPFDIECKAQEKLSIWDALTQAEENSMDIERIPMLVFTRNNSKKYAVVEFDKLLEIINKVKG